MANHHEVAHAWAHQTGKQRNGKRMFYEGDRIYTRTAGISQSQSPAYWT